jgi:hypothetical protein
MDIRYNAGDSKFVPPCAAAIRANRARLDSGNLIEVNFTEAEPGYSKRIEVEIRESDSTTFGTDWQSADASRFPARIKAAATALRDCGCTGRYAVEHCDGLLTIRVA